MSDDPTLRLTNFVRQNAIFQRLLEISLALNSTLALKPLLSEILTATCEIVDSEAASLLLYVTNADELRFVASNTPGENHEALLGTAVPVEGSVAGQIARENRPIIIQNADQDERIYRSVDIRIGFHTRSLLGVPMHVKGKVIGVLEALNKRSGSWTEEDARYATILASHAAVAIQNARQTEALRKAYAELDKLDKLKTDFIAIASHELRTPLSVILGYASFLKEDAQGKVSELASAVLNSALQLRSIIEDMTNLRFLHQAPWRPTARTSRRRKWCARRSASCRRSLRRKGNVWFSIWNRMRQFALIVLRSAWRSLTSSTMPSSSRHKAARFASAWSSAAAKCGFAWQIAASASRPICSTRFLRSFSKLKIT